jgi:hypothetical protein
MAGLLRPENVINIEDIIAIFVVEAIILCALARFRKYSARISRRFVFEARVANSVRRWEVACQGL